MQTHQHGGGRIEERLLDARDQFLGYIRKRIDDPELAELYWAWGMNRGILMTRGRGIEWTLTVAHTEAEVDRLVSTFAELSPARPSGSARA